MNALQVLKHPINAVGHVQTGFKTGALGIVVGAAVEYGAGYGMGQAYHRYGWTKLPRVAAVVGKATAIFGSLLGMPRVLVASADAIGGAGLTAMGLELGLKHAREATGKKAFLLPSGVAAPAGALPIDSIGKAELSIDELEALDVD